jgi:hypothetical protein
MKKKILGLCLALVLITAMIPAQATTVPSKTTNDLYTIEDYNVPLTSLFTILDTLTADAQAEYDAIVAYVNKGQAVAEYFGMDMPDLDLSEYISLGISNYEANLGDVTATIGFVTEYLVGQSIVVMFGYKDENGIIVWTALNAIVIEGGVQIDFPSELLVKAGSEAILAILS